jgi:putative FmdB family regulatory protein
MPLYRNECEACGHRFRILQLHATKSAVSCPACGSLRVRRLLSRALVQFKGSGYYKTDRGRRNSARKVGNVADDGPTEKRSEPETSDQKRPSSGASSSSDD